VRRRRAWIALLLCLLGFASLFVHGVRVTFAPMGEAIGDVVVEIFADALTIAIATQPDPAGLMVPGPHQLTVRFPGEHVIYGAPDATWEFELERSHGGEPLPVQSPLPGISPFPGVGLEDLPFETVGHARFDVKEPGVYLITSRHVGGTLSGPPSLIIRRTYREGDPVIAAIRARRQEERERRPQKPREPERLFFWSGVVLLAAGVALGLVVILRS
jgi:hypothetical protein